MRGPFLAIGLAAAMGLAPSLALGDCEPAPNRGLSFGARLGYAFPVGALAKGDSLHSNITGMIPFWIDAGYRLSRAFYIGAYFQWAPAFVAGDVCPGNLSCSAYGIRTGLNARLHFKGLIDPSAPPSLLDPWVGVGTGFESATIYISTPTGAKSHATNDGFEFANLQLGVDHQEGSFRIGIFTMISLAQYVHRMQTTATTSDGFVIPEPRLHGWFSLGVRGQYDL